MADEIEKTEDVEKVEETEEKKPEKKGRPLGLIIGAVLGILILGGGGFFLWSHFNSAEAAEGEVEEVEEILETNIFYTGFQTNIVNLAVSDEYDFMYLKYGFDVEVSDEAVITEIIAKQSKLIAQIDGVMSISDWNEICTLQGRERLAREAMRAINDELLEGQVIGLYFTTFVAQ